MKPFLLVACAVTLAGCGTDMAELNREPAMSRVGSGLTVQRDAIPLGTPTGRGVDVAFNSIYTRQSEDLFRDTRAMKTGDVVTVKISINDKAKLDNKSDRSRNSAAKYGLGFLANFNGASGDASASANASSDTSSRGRGLTDRSEEVEMSVAAVVTEILPNGNLVINGSQEVRVNYDMRVLNVTGIVRPRDITGNNVVSYEKIAEARISYGGRGRGMEVQQPAWGQQLVDKVTPF
ncbi:flagellar basal body L-ring protein FlgH [Bosea sp. (in: a-proteobacteria)]|uniref:flagellar basal body L-ring protein FlgH n=1 Tax=Bosea sp. (in: a-proteobacteria) TaxID=1871050 RepID=UPI000ACC4083|nr:flagellar basal body L-ring protein FlgH [Bosea sp. (in: a-proteobacteria)]WRH56612.1 MAG: flagellar basal body L-ring protein FlgH [Bosea sp. (in: a-proteobacteria)]